MPGFSMAEGSSACTEELGGGSWLIGRVTGSEYAKAASYPDRSDQSYPREPWFAVPTERVGDAHLAGLRRDRVSYIFAGVEERAE
ncbi:MAG: hypothetical protein ACREE2_04050 [Stellaceae bacterium]